MLKKRGFASFGLIGAIALVGGCKMESTKAPATQPTAATVASAAPATAPAAQPATSSTGPAVAEVASLPTTKPAAAGTTPTVQTPVAALVPTAGEPASPAAVPVAAPATAPSAAAGKAPDAPKTAPASAAPAVVDNAKVPQTARVPGWYQWRGPEQNGISRETGLPEKWDPDTGENVVWTSDVGGMSSPVVWNGKVYTWSRDAEIPYGEGDTRTLSAGPKTREALVCVDASNGKVLWKHFNNMTQTEVPFHRLGWSSPCVDPSTGRVYALGSQAWMLCLDGDTGKVIWQRQMTEEFGQISTFGGRTQAPTVDEDQVFITGIAFGYGDHARGQHRIFAFNKATGELNWSAATGGTPVDAPQNTPVVTVQNGVRLVVFAAGDGGVHAFQARSGKKAWTFKASKRGINTSVVIDGNKLYCTHGLGNYDSNSLGRVFCLDLSQIENGAPKELWKVTGIEAGFPTPVVTEKYVYVMDDRAKLYQYDKETGKQLWKQNCGQVGKASPVYADGKLYVCDGDGKVFIIKPDGDKKPKVLSKVDLSEKLGREYVVYGSPAIADGRVYIQAATKLYCIANKDGKPQAGEIPTMAEEKAPETKAATLTVIPADVVLKPGESVKFKVRAYDANGRFLGEVPGDKAQWAVAPLTIPPPPPRMNLPRPDSAGGGGDAGADAPAPAPIAPPPAAAPTKAGNLAGKVGADGTYTAGVVEAAPNTPQAGGIDVTVDGITAQARVRVFPPLPWKFDFEKAAVGKPPLTWLGAGGKFAVVTDPDNDQNKVLQKLMDIDLYYRARTNFGSVDMSNYTVQADVKANEKIISERRYTPDGGIINQRYVLVLNGLQQTLQIHIWPSALPDPRNPSGSKHATMAFPWEAKKWYRLKLEVTQQGDKAVARGKCWPVGGEEPKDWQLTLDDDIPNRTGNPGLFAVSLVGDQKSEVYYDNILVTDNKGQPAAAASVDQNK
jgi:outer membrane protein assembly factor BamB